MFNLNIPPTSLLGVDSGGLCSTPKTPEIVNSLIAMTNPLDNYTFTPNNNNNNCNNNNNNNNCENSNSNNNNQNGGILILHQQKQNFKNNNNNNNSANQQLLSQDSSHSSCSGSPLDSPCGTNTTPSVQQTRSQLIKAGLKLSIQSKRKMSSGDSSSGNEQSSSRKYARKSIGDSSITNDGDSSDEEDDSYADIKPSQLGLTPEDEDRRRRRRERNKIAATKCRMKKRERTINLVSESETLETQNVDLKTQVKSLEIERRKLFEMLQNHACVHPGGYQPPTKLLQSPAYKYLKNLGLGNGNGGDDGDDEDDDEIICNEQQQQHHQQQQQQQQPRTVIPPVATIKYSRNNGLRQQQHQQHQQQQQQQHNLQDILPNGYCKPSPTTHELGYLSSPTQDLTTCHLQQALNNINNHLQQQQQLHQQQQQQQHHQQHQQQIHSPILKTDYIPNCENSNGGTTVDSTTVDFVMKSELAETQSPYTTAKSAERFLCETNFDSFDIKNNSNSFNNHNNNNNNNINNNNNCTSHLNNNNTNSIDFHSQLAISCQSYDHILIKNDFLTHDSELLAQLAADGTESEFTDLDTGVSAYVHMTNGGCLA